MSEGAFCGLGEARECCGMYGVVEGASRCEWSSVVSRYVLALVAALCLR
jgi:hypothetical protein